MRIRLNITINSLVEIQDRKSHSRPQYDDGELVGIGILIHSVLLYLLCSHKDQNKGIKPCQVDISGIVDFSLKVVTTIEP